jgi:hypothetical protein
MMPPMDVRYYNEYTVHWYSEERGTRGCESTASKHRAESTLRHKLTQGDCAWITIVRRLEDDIPF